MSQMMRHRAGRMGRESQALFQADEWVARRKTMVDKSCAGPPMRPTGRWAAALTIALLATTGAGADTPAGGAAVGQWRTWVLASAGEIQTPPPPAADSAQTAAELAELRELQSQRSPITETAIHYWNSGPATRRWTEITLALIQRDKVNPVRAARILGCVHTAVADSVVAVWQAKHAYNRPKPSLSLVAVSPPLPTSDEPCYPSEHAAVARAASAMLSSLFPNDAPSLAAMAQEAGQTRLLAGLNYRSDVAAGVALGQAVAQQAMTRAATDGASVAWTGTITAGAGLWFQAPGMPAPLEPLAGTWKTWILASGSQLRPGPPPAFGSAQFLAELAEVKRVSANPTPSQQAVALFWADGAGTVTPPGHWFQIASSLIGRDGLSTSVAARILGLLGATVSDAAIACWDTKYAYWSLRPNQADPTIVTLVPTPPFPSYTSGHSTFSGASSEVLAYFFPQDAARLRYLAEEAALSRLYAGIHYRSDNETGKQVGRSLGGLAVQRDQLNGG
jgi:membrane-associated phospholipid phosphatase